MKIAPSTFTSFSLGEERLVRITPLSDVARRLDPQALARAMDQGPLDHLPAMASNQPTITRADARNLGPVLLTETESGRYTASMTIPAEQVAPLLDGKTIRSIRIGGPWRVSKDGPIEWSMGSQLHLRVPGMMNSRTLWTSLPPVVSLVLSDGTLKLLTVRAEQVEFHLVFRARQEQEQKLMGLTQKRDILRRDLADNPAIQARLEEIERELRATEARPLRPEVLRFET